MKLFSEYEAAALNTAVYPGQGQPLGLIYCSLKATGEAGEFAGHYLSRDLDSAERDILLAKEIGDELWYVAAKARELNTTLAELLETDSIADFEARYRRVATMPIGSLALEGTHYAGCFSEYLGKAIRDDGYGRLQPVADGLDFKPLTQERRQYLVNYLIEHAGNLAEKSQALGYSLGELAYANAAKLADRKARGVLGGSGDNR